VQGRGVKKLQDAGIDVTVGVLEDECKALNKRFMTFNTLHRPFILLKWAQTSNGFIDNNFHPTMISTPFAQMLSHKLRAENDAILVGHVTDERDHPQLNVRFWSGPNPIKLVLTHDATIPEMLQRLYNKNVQSLIVEGGRQTLQSFIDDDLWDEIRVETAPITFEIGTPAPNLPTNINVIDCKGYDKNVITTYGKVYALPEL
jgi:diaminohydroxyphosphoribosylaminopyrimidine deaminase/5-amino-6-(5-phosphoribosylamino)uracil reductase